eukprot:TRINITY_DN1176_c0_g2_i1.p1 TRINITY_DN1176_c0_g2~~TRINITY_DN1176_c0_g2_i1.p1  ORF type:complete len:995 (-),score=381.50 TRINITY_DN1176_c0_g2_i1:41-3025(-)
MRKIFQKLPINKIKDVVKFESKFNFNFSSKIKFKSMIENKAMGINIFNNQFRSFSSKDDKDDKDDKNDKKDEIQKKEEEKEKENEEKPLIKEDKETTKEINETTKKSSKVKTGKNQEESFNLLAIRGLKYQAKQPTPDQVPIFPLYERPLFPGTLTSCYVQDKSFLDSLSERLARGERYVGLFLVKESEKVDTNMPNITSLDQIHQIGTLGIIIDMSGNQSSPFVQIVISGAKRIKIKNQVESEARLTAKIEEVKEEVYDKSDPVVKAYTQEILKNIKDLSNLDLFYKEQVHALAEHIDFTNPAELADLICAISSNRDCQNAIEELNVNKRQKIALNQLKSELETHKIRTDISKQVDQSLQEANKKYILREQMKEIQKQLGLGEEKQILMSSYKEKLEKLNMPPKIKSLIGAEIERMSALESVSLDYNMIRNYIEWILSLPWETYLKENLSLSHAKKVLDDDHYGLKDVKERILEFIAVRNLQEKPSGKIICLQGPPGTGKTSIGESIARALGREHFKISMGGVGDSAEIRGHRRTYVGAMPGRFIQGMKTIKSSNPVLIIDEVDKLGNGWKGDPSAALLEVLDPKQNFEFRDHYLDVPYDFSKILFICTANVLDTIPSPLLDRMEVISLSGYVLQEKMEISKKYLIPKILKDCGLSPHNLSFSNSALEKLIKEYCREAGVRNLEKMIEKISRKIAYKYVHLSQSPSSPSLSPLLDSTSASIDNHNNPSPPTTAATTTTDTSPTTTDTTNTTEGIISEGIEKNKEKKEEDRKVDLKRKYRITDKNLESFIGKPIFTSERYYDDPIPGVVMGLVYTSMGGGHTYIETSLDKVSKSENFITTGKIGEVMKESTQIALTYAKFFFQQVCDENNRQFFQTNSLHMHVPEGGTPKEGPSAGITMVTSLLSLALGKSVHPDIAMTGELTLTGKVLKIGGVKEKTMGAQRANVKYAIFPKDNKRDFEELPDYIRKGISPVYVEYYKDVYDFVFNYKPQEKN